MARTTIGEIVSETRKAIKAVNPDAFFTDRHIYKLLMKNAKALMKREDRSNKLMSFNSIFQALDFVELEEIDKVAAGCMGISSECTFRRTVAKIPSLMQGYWGPLIRSVTSLDGSEELKATIPSSYLNISRSKNFKFNKTKYYWMIDDQLYFPNLDWEAVRIEGIFEGDISDFQCDAPSCIPRQEQPFNVPDYLHPEIQGLVLQEFFNTSRLAPDPAMDKQNPNR